MACGLCACSLSSLIFSQGRAGRFRIAEVLFQLGAQIGFKSQIAGADQAQHVIRRYAMRVADAVSGETLALASFSHERREGNGEAAPE
jgi:hypothetical protein